MKRATDWNFHSMNAQSFHSKVVCSPPIERNNEFSRFGSHNVLFMHVVFSLSQFRWVNSVTGKPNCVCVCNVHIVYVSLYPYFRLLNPYIWSHARFSPRFRCVRSNSQCEWNAFAYTMPNWATFWVYSSWCIWATIRAMCRHFANKQFSFKLIWCRCSLVLWRALAPFRLLSTHSTSVGVVNVDLDIRVRFDVPWSSVISLKIPIRELKLWILCPLIYFEK